MTRREPGREARDCPCPKHAPYEPDQCTHFRAVELGVIEKLTLRNKVDCVRWRSSMKDASGRGKEKAKSKTESPSPCSLSTERQPGD